MRNRFFPNYSGYVIISKFGMRTHPIDKVKKMHNGIDINASNDGRTGQVDYIMAHTGGTVEQVGYDSSAGNFIYIRVDSETLMAYFHMKAQSPFKKGDTVKEGDIIGRVGQTGKATGSHLHWGIKKNGTWIDPTPYLDKDYPVKKTEVKLVSVQVPVLKKGAKGEPVKALQDLLNLRLSQKLGDKFVRLDTDGSFGGKTLAAVELFQELYGLEVDGSVGLATWTELLNG